MCNTIWYHIGPIGPIAQLKSPSQDHITTEIGLDIQTTVHGEVHIKRAR